MYSPKRRFFLFRNPSFTGGGIVTYTYSWEDQTTASTLSYNLIRATNDFSTLIMTQITTTNGQQGAYISTDEGATWTRRVTGVTFGTGVYTVDVDIASSDGNIQYIANRAAPTPYAYLYKSTDRGSNWTELTSAGQRLWTTVQCSSNGNTVLSTDISGSGGTVRYSTDGGTNWTAVSSSPPGSSLQWVNSVISSDGTFMAVTPLITSNFIKSTDGGSTWTTKTNIISSRQWRSLRASSNCEVLIAGTVTNYPFYSLDYGDTWSSITDVSSATWLAAAVSPDGQKLAVAQSNGFIWISQDQGATWVKQDSPGSAVWRTLEFNSNGSLLIAGAESDKPWVATGTA